MATKLFVGGIAWATSEDALLQLFSTVGTVVSATILTDKFSGRSKGFGFVEMSTEEEATRAIEQLNGAMLDDRNITVSEAKPQAPREDRGGFGGGRGGNDRRPGGRGGDRGGFGGRRDNRY
ncbi:RNA-binding protein [candidate division WWE3 bacterium]|nr:RNA-binding protein [candidate division WWE3 bacterium]